jgi:hypothetical protein
MRQTLTRWHLARQLSGHAGRQQRAHRLDPPSSNLQPPEAPTAFVRHAVQHHMVGMLDEDEVLGRIVCVIPVQVVNVEASRQHMAFRTAAVSAIRDTALRCAGLPGPPQ